MDIQLIEHPTKPVAVVASLEEATCTPQQALDLMVTVQYETHAGRMVLPKAALCEDFFDLKTGLAGEILQKYTNYQIKLAIVGDFSGYQSRALRDFIRESNRGTQLFFLPDTETAVAALQEV